jgi:hypothetical protein
MAIRPLARSMVIGTLCAGAFTAAVFAGPPAALADPPNCTMADMAGMHHIKSAMAHDDFVFAWPLPDGGLYFSSCFDLVGVKLFACGVHSRHP